MVNGIAKSLIQNGDIATDKKTSEKPREKLLVLIKSHAPIFFCLILKAVNQGRPTNKNKALGHRINQEKPQLQSHHKAMPSPYDAQSEQAKNEIMLAD